MVCDVNFTLFENLDCTNIFKIPFRRKPSQNDKVKEIIKDINLLLESSEFNREYLCNHLLNKCCQLTGSEYGFIGIVRDSKTVDLKTNETINEQYLKTLAITNIAWNASSFNFYKQFVNETFEFTNLKKTIFGISILNKKSKIINKYDTTRNILPAGHPPIKRFLGIPIIINNQVMLYIGMCNKLEDFTKKDVKMIEKVLNIVGVTFYIMSKFEAEKSQTDLHIFSSVKNKSSECPILGKLKKNDKEGNKEEEIQMCTMHQ